MQCEWLLNYFSDETNNGKLYFNYPMVEAFYDFSSFNQTSFNNRIIDKKGLTSEKYKTVVNGRSVVLQNRAFSIKKNSIFITTLNLHVNKYFYLINETRNNSHYSDMCKLFKVEKDFLKKNQISVINCSVMIIHDYNPKMLVSWRYFSLDSSIH